LVEPVSGELRTRNIEIIAGERETVTMHREYGLKLIVDVAKTYFSPRLASERKRISDLVEPDEVIVDMFAGVAPFSIMIAKFAKPEIIYAFDKNKYAVQLAKQNIKLNNVLNKVEVIHADAKDCQNILTEKVDRIIMNLPFSAHAFLNYALRIAKDRCVIHYYDILHENHIQSRIENLREITRKNKFTLDSLDVRKIKTYAPREFYIGIDIKAKKMPM
jgi:tRNA (guanine37-N1)-methyltransferase